MSLYDKIRQLRNDTSNITCNSILEGIDDFIIEKIEWAAENGDPYFKKRKKILKTYIDRLGIDYSDDWTSLYTEYFETQMFMLLNRYLNIEKVPETSTNTPDYKIQFRGETYYVECKCFSVENPKKLHKEDQMKALDNQIQHEEQKNQGKSISFTMRESGPYDSDKEGYDPHSPFMCIEKIREKILQNYKVGQYEQGKTILFLDLSQLMTVNTKFVSLLPIYQDKGHISHYYTNGELWHLAFGRKGTPIFAPNESPDQSTLVGYLKDDGIMIKQPNICALIFKIWKDYLFLEPVGLIRADENLNKILDTINCLYNDEKNRYAYEVQRRIAF